MRHTFLYPDPVWSRVGYSDWWENSWIAGHEWVLEPSAIYNNHTVSYLGRTEYLSGIDTAFEDYPKFQMLRLHHFGGKSKLKLPRDYHLEFMLGDCPMVLDRIQIDIKAPDYNSTCGQVRTLLADHIALNAVRN